MNNLETARACWDYVKNILHLPPAVYGMKVSYERHIKKLEAQIKEEKQMDVFDLIEEEVSTGLILMERYEETGEISASQLVGIFRAIEGLCAASTVKQHSRKSRGMNA